MSVSRRGRSLFERAAVPLVRVFARLRVSPNALTAAGVALTMFSLLFYRLTVVDRFYFLPAGFALTAAALLDGLDGSLARLTGKESKLGAFVDSMSDRISDALIVVGFMLTGYVDGFLAVAMLASSMLVSYARARGESLNVSLKEVGLGERAVRVIAAILGTFLGYVNPAAVYVSAVFISVVSSITVGQRVWATASVLRG
ncbi:MAG: CDP-alcohol phosphatidyltransferase family protein [Candidatus Caldarchaeum sp.]|nr:CDP-alcohol phosphatidyltransferase family protein [Candidatus Caldarchaeum sp.]MCS7138159.1 CDP-alcohol phosphatidyltransferase family protein [Candidatus Caldarchaeum sp.]MDW8359538.1 CDP-alcohol phosphatidyltransferase family protein [Candidatus Caldarchaeum sp.]